MPFKSKAQMRKFGALMREGKISSETFEKWSKETKTPYKKLPNRKKK